jgi:amidase
MTTDAMLKDSWLAASIMAKRGMAKGQAGRRHELTIEKQGAFQYVYGPYAKPVMTVEAGDIVVVETEDAFGGVITSEQDSPTAKLKFPFLNPQCGPIAVSGVEKGDCLAIYIHAVETRGAQPAGTTCIIPEFGGLVGTASTALLNPPLPERVRKMHVDPGGVRWSDKITLPYQPFIGTIGVSPEIEAISSLQPDYHGGNMDLPDVAPGSVLYFPVHVAGGSMFVGDCHAAQGDGELSGVAIEQRATVTLQVDVIKNWSFAWPRLETDAFIMTIGSARPMEDAARIAYRELVRWMSADYGFDEIDAYMLLSQAGRMRLGNMVDPKYTMGASILKKYLVA